MWSLALGAGCSAGPVPAPPTATASGSSTPGEAPPTPAQPVATSTEESSRVVPTITTVDALFEHDGQEVILVGTYSLLDLRMRPKPPPRKTHAAVMLEGGGIPLEPTWAPEAVRPSEEHALDGQRVQVRGTFRANAAPPGDLAAPSGPSPCISPVVEITPVTD